jgi:hypothetical protein
VTFTIRSQPAVYEVFVARSLTPDIPGHLLAPAPAATAEGDGDINDQPRPYIWPSLEDAQAALARYTQQDHDR